MKKNVYYLECAKLSDVVEDLIIIQSFLGHDFGAVVGEYGSGVTRAAGCSLPCTAVHPPHGR